MTVGVGVGVTVGVTVGVGEGSVGPPPQGAPLSLQFSTPDSPPGAPLKPKLTEAPAARAPFHGLLAKV